MTKNKLLKYNLEYFLVKEAENLPVGYMSNIDGITKAVKNGTLLSSFLIGSFLTLKYYTASSVPIELIYNPFVSNLITVGSIGAIGVFIKDALLSPYINQSLNHIKKPIGTNSEYKIPFRKALPLYLKCLKYNKISKGKTDEALSLNTIYTLKDSPEMVDYIYKKSSEYILINEIFNDVQYYFDVLYLTEYTEVNLLKKYLRKVISFKELAKTNNIKEYYRMISINLSEKDLKCILETFKILCYYQETPDNPNFIKALQDIREFKFVETLKYIYDSLVLPMSVSMELPLKIENHWSSTLEIEDVFLLYDADIKRGG